MYPTKAELWAGCVYCMKRTNPAGTCTDNSKNNSFLKNFFMKMGLFYKKALN